jgi:hypothetical protein
MAVARRTRWKACDAPCLYLLFFSLFHDLFYWHSEQLAVLKSLLYYGERWTACGVVVGNLYSPFACLILGIFSGGMLPPLPSYHS